MNNFDWWISASALRQAKKCISLIQQETGVRLRLSEPNFLRRLEQMVSAANSKQVRVAYQDFQAHQA